jgi:ribosomal protein S18 acetylase RimI-like enzyme
MAPVAARTPLPPKQPFGRGYNQRLFIGAPIVGFRGKGQNPYRLDRMDILRYKPEHESAIFSAIGEDPDWDMFTKDSAIDDYRKRLRTSITYVCYDNDSFCGYVRALLDDRFAVYISELYVAPMWRNRMIGRSLLARVKADFHHLTVYALSDEDAYYEKIGAKRVGSVFEIGL